MDTRTVYWAVMLCYWCGTLAWAAAQSLLWLGTLGGSRSEAYGVDAASRAHGVSRTAVGRSVC